MTADAQEILEALQLQMIRNSSPWRNRREAAAYCANMHPTSIDRAADAGLIHRHYPNGPGTDPCFKTSELDLWMEGKSSRDKRRAQKSEPKNHENHLTNVAAAAV